MDCSCRSLNSDIPGTVRVKVTEAVQDRFGQGQVLLPIDTTFLGRQEGRTQYGQARVPVTITMAILPNGSAIAWKNGQAGDATGAPGIPAKVDNHYGKVILGAGLSALAQYWCRVHPLAVRRTFSSRCPRSLPRIPRRAWDRARKGLSDASCTLLPR